MALWRQRPGRRRLATRGRLTPKENDGGKPMSALGTLSELPAAYLDGLAAHNLVPLWPSLRKALPHDAPLRRTQPVLWRYADIRPRLLEAGDLTPIEKAERRVLVLANPGLGLDNMQATPSIYIGMQLILPRETAPNHRHTPSAVRFVVEGEGRLHHRRRREAADGARRSDSDAGAALARASPRRHRPGDLARRARSADGVRAGSFLCPGRTAADRAQSARPFADRLSPRRAGALSRLERPARELPAVALSVEGSARGAGGDGRGRPNAATWCISPM